MKNKKSMWVISYVLFLIAFTVYIALDTFVIEKVYSSAQTKISEKLITTDKTSQEQSANKGNEATESTDNTQTSENTQEVESQENAQTSENTENSQNSATNTVKTSTDTAYEDDNIKINLSTQNYNDTVVYVADVKLSSADYLKTALAQNLYGRKPSF